MGSYRSQMTSWIVFRLGKLLETIWDMIPMILREKIFFGPGGGWTHRGHVPPSPLEGGGGTHCVRVRPLTKKLSNVALLFLKVALK